MREMLRKIDLLRDEVRLHKRLNIKPSDFVLEVGSGHNPMHRSDILSDKYVENCRQRGGKIKIDNRPFIQCDAHKLPFKTDSFDYIICRHVIEHLDNPGEFLEEISRVGKRGYIECPSLIWELLHPTRDYHKWYILEVKNTLVFKKKPLSACKSIFGTLFETKHGGIANTLEYRIFAKKFENIFLVKHEWKGNVRYVIEPKDPYLLSFFEEPWDENKIKLFIRGQQGRYSDFLRFIINTLNTLFEQFFSRVLGK